jgi:DNA-directed RNA polymerase specialized sigma24 family protein
MSEAAISAWQDWVKSEAAVKHIKVVIAKRYRNRRQKPCDSDVDDLVGDIQLRLLEKAESYDPARGAPCTFGSMMIPNLLIDVLDWLRVHFPDRYRAVRLACLVPRQDDDGFEYDPPDAETVTDTQGPGSPIPRQRSPSVPIR